MQSLEQYRLLKDKVDRFCTAVQARFPEQMVCRRGCDACCTHIGVLPVEALAIALAVASLPPEQAEQMRTRARQMADKEECPLLLDRACLLYTVRPIICRTQGMPLLVEEDGGRRIDYCPLNFQGLESLPGDAVLNLDALNQSLAAINILCLRELAEAGVELPERLSIAEAILLELE